jgi:hypothetical protein
MKSCSLFVFIALGGWLIGALTAHSQTMIAGQAFEPTQKQCLSALGDGTLVPIPAPDGDWRAKTYVYHEGNVFLIVIEGSNISCQAWRM